MLARGDIQNLMVLMPPQHGKSQVITVHFPVWWLEHHPEQRVGVASYNDTLAMSFARQSRRIAQKNGLLDFAPDRNAVEEWELTTGGKYKAVGIGAGITGNPLELAIIDDPIKSREEAESQLRRDKVWDWYVSELSTRTPKGQKLLVMTPWHFDDLHGRILESEEAKHWTVIKCPAIAEVGDALGRAVGEPLCPERMTLDRLLTQKALDPGMFEALFQCNPVPNEGGFFKTHMIGVVDAAPAGLRVARAYDFGATKGGDPSASALIGASTDGRYFILDAQSRDLDVGERDQWVVNQAGQDGRGVKIGIPQDPGAAGKAQIQYTGRMLGGFAFEVMPTTGDKPLRASPFASQVNVGNVSLVRGPWNRAFLDQLAQFPQAKHDDMVDAAGDAFKLVQSGEFKVW